MGLLEGLHGSHMPPESRGPLTQYVLRRNIAGVAIGDCSGQSIAMIARIFADRFVLLLLGTILLASFTRAWGGCKYCSHDLLRRYFRALFLERCSI